MVSPPLVGLIRSTSSSSWPPRARSSHATSSSSLSPPEDDGRLVCFRIDANRSLKSRAYSASFVGGSGASGVMAVGCETGINCLKQGVSIVPEGRMGEAKVETEGAALTLMSRRRCAPVFRAGGAALLGPAGGRCGRRYWCHSLAGTGR
jgi:hypothetical protein